MAYPEQRVHHSFVNATQPSDIPARGRDHSRQRARILGVWHETISCRSEARVPTYRHKNIRNSSDAISTCHSQTTTRTSPQVASFLQRPNLNEELALLTRLKKCCNHYRLNKLACPIYQTLPRKEQSCGASTRSSIRCWKDH